MSRKSQKTVATAAEAVEAQVETNETKVVQTEKTYNVESLKKELGSWSSVIRFLDGEGLDRGTISKLTGKRYQHVRNVLITPIKKSATAES